MTARDFRRIALGMTGATEGAHMGHPDFRAEGRIFATLQPGDRRGMVKLTPEQQRELVRDHALAFEREAGACGRQGCTRVWLDQVGEDTLGIALTLARQNVAKKRPSASRPPLRRSFDVERRPRRAARR